MAVRGTPLEGPVEVDVTFLGGPEPGKRGRPAGGGQEWGAAGKTLVAGAVEVRHVPIAAPDPKAKFPGQIWQSASVFNPL